MKRQVYIPSKYKCVAGVKDGGSIKWYVKMPNVSESRFDTEREAAIAADKVKINQGKGPVNILKRVKKD